VASSTTNGNKRANEGRNPGKSVELMEHFITAERNDKIDYSQDDDPGVDAESPR